MNPTQEDREMLVISYLTGEASPAQREAFEAAFEADPEFRAYVREMEDWLAPLDTAAASDAPPAGVLGEILSRIETQPDAAPSVARSADANRWKLAAIAASAVAIISTALHVMPAGRARPAQQFIALLSDDTAPAIVVVVYDPAERRVVAQSANAQPPAGLVWQLWRLREGEAAPTSLGLLTGEPGAGFALNAELAPATDRLAISVEPAGGSTTAGPSGPVVFTGGVRAL